MSEDGARGCGADGEPRGVRTRPGEGGFVSFCVRFISERCDAKRVRVIGGGAFDPIERASVNRSNRAEKRPIVWAFLRIAPSRRVVTPAFFPSRPIARRGVPVSPLRLPR